MNPYRAIDQIALSSYLCNLMTCILSWQSTDNSNVYCISQSDMCYHYTSALYIKVASVFYVFPFNYQPVTIAPLRIKELR